METNCKNQFVLNQSDVQKAEEGLFEWFGACRTVTVSTASYKYGSAVAYVCNYGKSSVTRTGCFPPSL